MSDAAALDRWPQRPSSLQSGDEMNCKELKEDADTGWAVGGGRNDIMFEELALVCPEHVETSSWVWSMLTSMKSRQSVERLEPARGQVAMRP